MLAHGAFPASRFRCPAHGKSAAERAIGGAGTAVAGLFFLQEVTAGAFYFFQARFVFLDVALVHAINE